MRAVRLIGIAALVAGMAALVVLVRGREPARTIGPEGGRASESPERAIDVASGAGVAAQELDDARRAVERSVSTLDELGGRVIDAAGLGVEGTDVAWTPTPEAFCEGSWRWSVADSEGVEVRSLRARTDAAGRFALGPLDAGCGAALWASKPGFRAAFRAFGPEDDLPIEPLVLEESDSVLVRVTDAGGTPVPGVTVVQRGMAFSNAAAPYKDRWVALLFVQRTTCNDRGEARIASFPGEQRVQAEIDGATSAPRSVHPGTGAVDLRLAGAFQLHGSARIEGALDLPSDVSPALTLSIFAVDGSVRRPLLERRLAPGDFGPLAVPLDDADRVGMRLEGAGLFPAERTFARPGLGERVRVDLVARAGAAQWFRVTDLAGNGLADASVEVAWMEGRERRSVVIPSRGDGYVRALGVRPGSVVAIGSCPGYASRRTDALDVPGDPPATVEIRLAPACTLAGRVVTWDGRPVRDFEITRWPKEDARARITTAFRDRPDGAFVLDDVEAGDLVLVASGAESSGSDTVAVTTRAEERSEIELTLSAPAIGRGRVVLESTGAPVADAVVHLYTMGAAGPIAGYGPGTPVGADGSFQLDGCTNGRNAIFVAAEGRAGRYVEADGANGFVEFGTIALPEPAELELALYGRGAAGFAARITGPDAREGLRFEDGPRGPRIRVADLTPGYYEIEIARPDGSWDVALADLLSGSNPPVSFHGDEGGGGLEVVVALADGAAPAGGAITIEGADPDGRVRQRVVRLRGDAAYRIPGLTSGRVEAFLTDERARVIATAAAEVVEGTVRTIRLSGDATPVRIRLLSPAGEAVAGAWVHLVAAQDGSAGPVGTTDADGEIAFPSVRPGAYLVTAEHPRLGMLVDRALEVPETRDEVAVELELAADAALRARVADGETPLAGVACTLIGATGNVLAEPRASGADGGVEFRQISAGRYRLRLTHESLWPREAVLEASADAPWQPVVVRRLGDATLALTNAVGAVAGVEVVLIDVETGTDVADWVAEGRIARTPERGASDAKGRVRWEGLPRGTYSWSLPGYELSGVLVVPAGDEVVLPITVP